MKIDVAGVRIDNLSKAQVLARLSELMQTGTPHYAVTPYSELVLFALKDRQYKQVLNAAALALPDGISILWAAKFLSLKSNFRDLIRSLAAIIFKPAYIRNPIRERISGSELVYDLANLACEKKYSLSLVGGREGVASQAAARLKQLYPNLRINLALSDQAFDEQIVRQIAASNSDILLIAYQPPRQEFWLAENLAKFKVKLAIGLGGTFDYLAGKRPPAAKFLRFLGLEWLWRLLTQPWRLKRIWNAVPVFIYQIYQYKHASNHE